MVLCGLRLPGTDCLMALWQRARHAVPLQERRWIADLDQFDAAIFGAAFFGGVVGDGLFRWRAFTDVPERLWEPELPARFC